MRCYSGGNWCWRSREKQQSLGHRNSEDCGDSHTDCDSHGSYHYLAIPQGELGTQSFRKICSSDLCWCSSQLIQRSRELFEAQQDPEKDRKRVSVAQDGKWKVPSRAFTRRLSVTLPADNPCLLINSLSSLHANSSDLMFAAGNYHIQGMTSCPDAAL